MKRSTETIAHEAYLKLPPSDKMLVNSWRALGNGWFTSVVNSGVLSPNTKRVRPEQAAHAAECERLGEIIGRERARLRLTSEELTRKETAQHEAAHLVVAQSFGLDVKLAHILPGGTGRCLHEPATSAFQTAAIALAGETWISVFRSGVFVKGAGGCEDDRRVAIRALPDQMQRAEAYRYGYLVLKSNQDTVQAVADRIEKDGCYFP